MKERAILDTIRLGSNSNNRTIMKQKDLKQIKRRNQRIIYKKWNNNLQTMNYKKRATIYKKFKNQKLFLMKQALKIEV